MGFGWMAPILHGWIIPILGKEFCIVPPLDQAGDIHKIEWPTVNANYLA